MSIINNYEENFKSVQRALPLLNVETTMQNMSYQIMWLPDTGVQQDTINISLLKQLDEDLTAALKTQENQVATGVDTIGLLGTIDAKLHLNGRSYDTNLKVTKHAIAPILSKNGCIALCLINPEWPYEADAMDVGGGDSISNEADNKRMKKAYSSQKNITPIISSQNVIQVDTIINGESLKINWLPETGTNSELMSASDFKKLGDSITSALKIKTFGVIGEDGQDLGVVGTVDAVLTRNGRTYPTEIGICERVEVPTLSKEGCIALGLLNPSWPYSRSTAISSHPMLKHVTIRKTLLAGKKFECTFRERGCNKIGMSRREWEDHEAKCKFNPCPNSVRKCPCPFCHPSTLTDDTPPSPMLSRHLVQVHQHLSTDLLFTGQETEPIVLRCVNFSRTFLPNAGLHFGGNLRIVDKTSGAVLGEYITVAQCYHPEEKDTEQETCYALTCCRLSPPPGPGVSQYSVNYMIKSVNNKKSITWKNKPINFAQLKALIIENQKGSQRFHYSIPESIIRQNLLGPDDEFNVEIKFEK